MKVECIKNLAGAWYILLDEEDNRCLCIRPNGTKVYLEKNQLNMDSRKILESTSPELTDEQRENLAIEQSR